MQSQICHSDHQITLNKEQTDVWDITVSAAHLANRQSIVLSYCALECAHARSGAAPARGGDRTHAHVFAIA